MLGASEDLGLFKIFVKAVRKLADNPSVDQEELYLKLIKTLTKARENLLPVRPDRNQRDVNMKGLDRYYYKFERIKNDIDACLTWSAFEEAESPVIWGSLVLGGHIRIIGTQRQVDRLINKISNKAGGEDIVEELIDENHIIRCEDCCSYELHDDICWISDEPICRTCISNNYVWSDYEDEYIHCDQAADALDEDGESITIHCDNENFRWSDQEECYVHVYYSSHRLLSSYHSSKSSFRPIKSDWIKTHGPFYMGCELEVEVKAGDAGSKVEQLHDVLNAGHDVGHRAFFEEDGSLSYGFEIITQPMGLDLHSDFWKWLNDNNLRRSLVSHNTSTCGLHVHLSRRPLSQLQINKMISFINHPDNMALIEGIARRYHTNYARIKEKKLGNAHKTDDRYEAINVTNSGTIEFRIFKGSLKYESVMAALEFVNALREFTSPASGVGFNLSQDKFMEFINHSAMLAETKNLRPYLNQRLERN